MTLGAAELARAIAAGELSARAAVQASLDRIEERQRRAQRGDGHARRRSARRGGCGGRAARPRRTGAAAARRAVHRQGEHRRRGDGDVAGHARRRAGGARRAAHRAPARRGRDPDRADEPSGPRAALAHRQRAPRRDGQPLGRVAEPGREQRRRCGRAGERHGRVRGRQRLRRLVAGAGGARRRVRAAPDAGAPCPGVRRPAADEPPADGERRAARRGVPRIFALLLAAMARPDAARPALHPGSGRRDGARGRSRSCSPTTGRRVADGLRAPQRP